MFIFKFDEPVIIFNNIPDVKEDHQKLNLLPNMYFFVVYEDFIIFIFGFPNKDKREQRNAIYFKLGKRFLANNYHENKYNKDLIEI